MTQLGPSTTIIAAAIIIELAIIGILTDFSADDRITIAVKLGR